MLYAAAAIYALFYWWLAFRRPAVALMLIFAAAPFQQDLSIGGLAKFSLAEINLLLAAPIAVISGARMRLGPTAAPSFLYLAIGVLASYLSWRSTSLLSLVQSGIYLVITPLVFATLPRRAADLKASLNGLVIIGVFLASLTLVFRSGFVIGLHKNGVGASLTGALLVCTELWFGSQTRRGRLLYLGSLGVISLGLLLTLSRGAWLGALVGLGLILFLRREFTLIIRSAAVLVPLITVMWFTLPDEAREYATDFRSESYNINARWESVDYALEEYRRGGVFGVGVGLRKEYDATNILLATLAETGIPGVLAFLAIQIAPFFALRKHWRVLRRHPLAFSLAVVGGALFYAKFAHGLVDHYWGRGSMTIAMAGIGMAAFAIHAARLRTPLGYAQARKDRLAVSGNPAAHASLPR